MIKQSDKPGFETKFAADSMLGKLAKWLRIMGYDTYYRSFYREMEIENLTDERRIFITRNRSLSEKYTKAIFLHSDLVGDQLMEMKYLGYIDEDRTKWFSICSRCNQRLAWTLPEKAEKNIPEYIFYQNVSNMRFCQACGRYYWPGSHKKRILQQLERWGIIPLHLIAGLF